MSPRLIDGKKVAADVLREAGHISAKVLKRRGRAPTLAIVAAPGNAAGSYLQAKLRACAAAGVQPLVHRVSARSRRQAFALLQDLAHDAACDAVLVETPYPAGLSPAEVASTIPPAKDAEGLTPEVYGRFFLAKDWDEAADLIGPCTAVAIARLAVASRARLTGRRALVIGRSATVGRPTAHLLVALNMTVTVAHSRSGGLGRLCRESDLIVAAAGSPGLIQASWVKPGAVLIDAGVHRTAQGWIGDAAKGAAARAGVATPVPGGVGPVTTAVAVLQAARLAALRSGV